MGRAAISLAVAAGLGLALVLGGCGFGAGKKLAGGAELVVTKDFGQSQLFSARVPSIRKDETVMRFLESKQEVTTSYGGKFVDSINGLASSTSNGRSDWFYYVNGIEASVGAADRTLSPGDVVQWDYRRWDATMHVPAIVGAFPEPFVHGTSGKWLPVRLECSSPTGAACTAVENSLSALGVPASAAELGSAAGPQTLRVVVGPWSALRTLQGAVGSIERGPAASGVFARFSRDGHTLTLLDVLGRSAGTAPPHSGLIAATAAEGSQPAWIISGVDDAGVLAAAHALDQNTLHDAFAVAVTPVGDVRLPVGAAR